jgi:hypothetical protein
MSEILGYVTKYRPRLDFSPDGKKLCIDEEQIDLSFGSNDLHQKPLPSNASIHLNEARCWVVSGTHYLLRLPAEHRPWCI